MADKELFPDNRKYWRTIGFEFVIFCTVITVIAAFIFCGRDAAVRSAVATPLLFGILMVIIDSGGLLGEDTQKNDNWGLRLIATVFVAIIFVSSLVWLAVCGKKAALRAAVIIPVVTIALGYAIYIFSVYYAYKNPPPVFFNAPTYTSSE